MPRYVRSRRIRRPRRNRARWPHGARPRRRRVRRRTRGPRRRPIPGSARVARVLATCLAAAALATLPAPGCDGVPTSAATSNSSDTVHGDGPIIDWTYWASVNPDVIGWITVPGTSIDGPVVQAPSDDPTYYLTHDVYRAASAYGCPYLDAACPKGLASPNCVVAGHNMSDGTMFAPLRSYLDAAFASEHRAVVVSTPQKTQTYQVAAVRIVDGRAPEKRTSFATIDALRAWLSEQLAQASMTLEAQAADRAKQVLTLATCMPGGTRRVLVFAVDAPPST